MDVSNKTLGVQNITGNATGNATAWNIQEFEAELGNLFASQLAGGTQYMGVFGLIVLGYFMYSADVSEDVMASVMVPATFFMASQGYLPYGQGVVYAMLLAISAIFFFGVVKYADR
jgi:hypothetical protein